MTDIIEEDIEKIVRSLNPAFFEDKRTLVTGGAGFLGSYLCDALIRLNAEVTCVDNFSTGKKQNIAHLATCREFEAIDSDVRLFDSKHRFDYIFHFASRASPLDYQAHSIETLLVNSVGAHRVLEHARKSDSRIVLASTSEVYGDPQKFPTTEEYWGNVNPVGPRSCYDEGKRFSEALFMAYHRELSLNMRIARIHNTYGPRIRPDGFYGRAVPRFILQALKGQDLTVYGDGSQTRSFGYVSDIIRGILLVFCTDGTDGKIFNIGNPQETRVIELARKIIEMTESKSRIVFCPLPEDDPMRRNPDISKAVKELHWNLEVTLEKGLARTIEWFRSHMNDELGP